MRASWKALAITALAAGTIFANTGAANAATATDVSYNGCTADLWLTGSSDDYATAATYNSSSSYTCVFWLERGTYSGGSTTGWTSITGATSISGPSGERDTGTYWDGPGTSGESLPVRVGRTVRERHVLHLGDLTPAACCDGSVPPACGRVR
jgi:hypothetical protein